MDTNGSIVENKIPLPSILQQEERKEQQGEGKGCCCSVFNGYDASVLMSETGKPRKLITKR